MPVQEQVHRLKRMQAVISVQTVDKWAFDFIHEFNSMNTLAVLGDAANELAKPVLLEIGRTIRAYNRSHEQEQTENLTQKGLANTSKIDYNALKRESESRHEEQIDNNQNSVERGNSDESDIRKERGLSDPDITGGHSAGGNRNEVRNDERDLSEGEPQGRVPVSYTHLRAHET